MHGQMTCALPTSGFFDVRPVVRYFTEWSGAGELMGSVRRMTSSELSAKNSDVSNLYRALAVETTNAFGVLVEREVSVLVRWCLKVDTE